MRLSAEMAAARERTDEIFDVLQPEAIYERPIPERHRLIFYLGHLEAFDWNLIGRRSLGLPSFHPEFDKLFEFGIDPELGQLPSDEAKDWPAVADVRAYVNEIRARLDDSLREAPEQLVHVAVEHRLMHAETLAYLLHNLSYEFKKSGPPPTEASTLVGPNRMIEIPAGEATLGQSAEAFGWDNEFPERRVHVPAFRISKYKITNGEYARCLGECGHEPHFWIRQVGQWFYRGMFGLVPLPMNAPAWVTHDEARQYAEWSGKSLPTEEQYHRAAYGTPEGGERRYPWGDAAPSPEHGNFDFTHWDPIPVGATPAGDSAFGVSGLAGNGWEWTSTVFASHPGFRHFDFYPGYSENFFDGGHYVLKGASPRTAAVFLRRSFRNWFRPEYPYLYAGFRLVEN